MQQKFVQRTFHFLKEKMKVCLAAQIFSSVADVLIDCRDSLKLLIAYQE